MSKDNLIAYAGTSGMVPGDSANTPNAYVKRDSSGNIACAAATVVGVANTGPDAESIATVTSNYSVGANDCTILADATSGVMAVTLPAVASSAGRRVKVKKMDNAHNVTIQTPDAQTIDGASTLVLSVQYKVATLQCVGASGPWVIVGN